MSDVSARYMIDGVPTAVHFYTAHLEFTLERDASPAFAEPFQRLRVGRSRSRPGSSWASGCTGSRHAEEVVCVTSCTARA